MECVLYGVSLLAFQVYIICLKFLSRLKASILDSHDTSYSHPSVVNKENVSLLQSLLPPGDQRLMSLVFLDISFNKLSVV